MLDIIIAVSETSDWKEGDRVKTFRGTTHGVIVRLMEDGRVVWKPDGSEAELVALPESLVRENKKRT